jgi:hypothetical protein
MVKSSSRVTVDLIFLFSRFDVRQQLAPLVVVWRLVDRFANDVPERREDIERLARVPVVADLVQPPSAYLVVAERFRAVLHQRMGPHVVVGAHHQAAQRVEQRIVAVATVARPQEVLDQRSQLLVAEPPVQVRLELLLLTGADVVELVVRSRLFEEWIVLLLGGRA